MPRAARARPRPDAGRPAPPPPAATPPARACRCAPSDCGTGPGHRTCARQCPDSDSSRSRPADGRRPARAPSCRRRRNRTGGKPRGPATAIRGDAAPPVAGGGSRPAAPAPPRTRPRPRLRAPGSRSTLPGAPGPTNSPRCRAAGSAHVPGAEQPARVPPLGCDRTWRCPGRPDCAASRTGWWRPSDPDRCGSDSPGPAVAGRPRAG